MDSSPLAPLQGRPAKHSMSSNQLSSLSGPSAEAADADIWRRRKQAATEAGSSWVTMVTDPYHDYNLTLAGVPDRNPSLSFVRSYKDRQTIRVPAGYGEFDVHVFFTPTMYQTTVRDARRYPPHSGPGGAMTPLKYTTATGDSCDFGPVTAIIVPAGSDTSDPSRIVIALGPLAQGALAMSPARLVSAGFEVHNTTAKLYEGGSVTVWKANELRSTDVYEETTVNLIDVSLGAPSTVRLANALPTSRTWEASRGVYCVGQPDFNDLSFQTSRGHSFYTATGEDATNQWFFGFAGPVSGPSPGHWPMLNAGYVPSGLVPSGAIFCGLNEQSVLTLDTRLVIEYCPSLSSSDIALATPTAMYDPEAIASAAKIFDLLPPGVPVGFNGAGDWFRMILRAGGKALQTIAPFLPHPAAKAVGGVVGRVAEHFGTRTQSASSGRMVTRSAEQAAKRVQKSAPPQQRPVSAAHAARQARRNGSKR